MIEIDTSRPAFFAVAIIAHFTLVAFMHIVLLVAVIAFSAYLVLNVTRMTILAPNILVLIL